MTRRPRIELAVGPAVPGAAVRVLPAACVLLAGWLLASGTLPWLVCLAAAGAVTWRPELPGAAVFSLAAGAMVISGDDLLDVRASGAAAPVRLAGAVLALHLLVVTTGLASHVTWRALVEVRVVGRALRGAFGAQALAQAVLLLVLAVRATDAPGGEWWRVAAAVAATAVALVVVPREWVTRRNRDPR